ncbi:hypothetical protein ACW95P_01745 [Candidatus Mycoplasma pogonae]
MTKQQWNKEAWELMKWKWEINDNAWDIEGDSDFDENLDKAFPLKLIKEKNRGSLELGGVFKISYDLLSDEPKNDAIVEINNFFESIKKEEDPKLSEILNIVEEQNLEELKVDCFWLVNAFQKINFGNAYETLKNLHLWMENRYNNTYDILVEKIKKHLKLWKRLDEEK